MIPLKINPALAEEHYNNVKLNILHQIDRILKQGGIIKGPKGAKVLLGLSNNLRNSLNNFQIDPDSYLKPIILLSPSDMEPFLNNASPLLPLNHTDDFEIVDNIFVSNGYEHKSFDKMIFINKIGIDVCPYCNRNYIYTTTRNRNRNRNRKIKPEIDHFYPTNKYPILALSYYNLIPSCEPCNGFGAKGSNDSLAINLISPYLLNDNDFVFSYKINHLSIINPLSGKSDIEVFFSKGITINSTIFNLKDLYNLHYDHALELIIKKRVKYSEKYRKYLKSYKGLQFSNTEIDRMILGNYSLTKEQHKRPLAKMYQDIGKELGLIKLK